MGFERGRGEATPLPLSQIPTGSRLNPLPWSRAKTATRRAGCPALRKACFDKLSKSRINMLEWPRMGISKEQSQFIKTDSSIINRDDGFIATMLFSRKWLMRYWRQMF